MDSTTKHYTTNSGCPLDNPQATLKIGDSKLPGVKGQLLLQDINLLETIAHATHERIPERIVHAKGAGAYGVFEVTPEMPKLDTSKQNMTKPDITKYTSAKFLSQFGKQTRLFCRFSTVTGGRGSADTVRDTRGFPKWTVSAQIIEPGMVDTLNSGGINIFDPTKVIPFDKCPLTEFGTITLNENPKNFFSEVEGVSFSPTAIVPGWDVSPDPILQTRLFAYGSAARYRLGINFNQSEVNKPKCSYNYNPTKRDGTGNIDNLGSLANYIPGDQAPVTIKPANQYERSPDEQWDGKVISFDSPVDEKVDYVQPTALWTKVLTPAQQNSLVENVAASLSKAEMKIRMVTYGIFTKIDPTLAMKIMMKIEGPVSSHTPNTNHDGDSGKKMMMKTEAPASSDTPTTNHDGDSGKKMMMKTEAPASTDAPTTNH